MNLPRGNKQFSQGATKQGATNKVQISQGATNNSPKVQQNKVQQTRCESPKVQQNNSPKVQQNKVQQTILPRCNKQGATNKVRISQGATKQFSQGATKHTADIMMLNLQREYQIAQSTDRLDLGFDFYRTKNRKSQTRPSQEKTRDSVRKKTPIYKEFNVFIRDNENKTNF